MLHELAETFYSTVYPLADATSSATVKAAFIGGLALVLGATVPQLLSRREREPRVVRDLRNVEVKLRTQIEGERDEWERTAKAAIRGIEVRDHELDRLRALVVSLGGNPYVPPTDREGRLL